MEEFNETQIPTNVCRTKIIFRGDKKQLTKLVDAFDNEMSIFTYTFKLAGSNNPKVAKVTTFMEDLLIITKDTFIEYIEFTLDGNEVEMSLLDFGYCNVNIINLIASLMGLEYILLACNQDIDFFVNTDKSYKHFKHKVALINFNKEAVAFGSSIQEAFKAIDITIPDKLEVLDFITLLSSYNLVVSEFEDKLPSHVLNDNYDILVKYQRLCK